MQHISQFIAPGPSSDCCDWLECAVSGTAGVLRSCPALTCVAVEYRVVDIRFENRIDVKLYRLVSSESIKDAWLVSRDAPRRGPTEVYDEEFVM
jgi:hypothetical protein